MNDENQSSEPPPMPQQRELPPLDPSNFRSLFDSLLRQPEKLSSHEGIETGKTILKLGAMALVAVLVFGFVLGTFSFHEQLWAAPLKLGCGLLFAGLICYPSLYIFSSLAGSTLSATRLAAILSAMLALCGLLLLGFAPAVWIFTQGTSSFGFMGTLAIASWLVALIFGVRFLGTALKINGATQQAPIAIWCVVFLLVTLQLTTSLRPILGRSDEFLTNEKKFFIQHWAESGSTSLENQKWQESDSNGDENQRTPE